MKIAEYMPWGIPYISEEIEKVTTTNDNLFVLWNTFMFPTSKLTLHTYTPATILTLLAQHDLTRFTCTVTQELLHQQHFRLQVDDGANRSVANNIDYLHTSWDISP